MNPLIKIIALGVLGFVVGSFIGVGGITGAALGVFIGCVTMEVTP